MLDLCLAGPVWYQVDPSRRATSRDIRATWRLAVACPVGRLGMSPDVTFDRWAGVSRAARAPAASVHSRWCLLRDRPFHVLEPEADPMGRHEPVSQELVERDPFHP